MPIINTQAQIDQRIIDFINSRWRGGKHCTLCNTNSWNVESNLAELRFLHYGSFVLGGPVVPLVVVTCNNCGHTILFNAMKAGWTPPLPEAPQGAAETEEGGVG